MANVDEKQYVNRWYLIHTYSGYERKVRDDWTKRIISEGLNDKVFRILVPEEEVEEIKIKKRTGEEIKEKVFELEEQKKLMFLNGNYDEIDSLNIELIKVLKNLEKIKKLLWIGDSDELNEEENITTF